MTGFNQSACEDKARELIQNKDSIPSFIEKLSGASRRDRQFCARVLALVAKSRPEYLLGHMRDFASALGKPEAQTRWEILDLLTSLIPYDSRGAEIANASAESALFDEESGALRLAAMRYFCVLGASTRMRSQKYWPLINEAIQCYHGDFEFSDMMSALQQFAQGKLDDEVACALYLRLSFDAEFNSGSIKKKAQNIIETLNISEESLNEYKKAQQVLKDQLASACEQVYDPNRDQEV